VEKAFDSMSVFLDKWKRYSTLWKHDKHSMLDKSRHTLFDLV
jgi:hypothetical protein